MRKFKSTITIKKYFTFSLIICVNRYDDKKINYESDYTLIKEKLKKSFI